MRRYQVSPIAAEDSDRLDSDVILCRVDSLPEAVGIAFAAFATDNARYPFGGMVLDTLTGEILGGFECKGGEKP